MGIEIFVEIDSNKGVAAVWGREFNGEEAGKVVLGVGLFDDAVGIVRAAGKWEERSMRPMGKEIELEVGVCVFVGLRYGEVRSGTEAGTETEVNGH